LDKFSRQNTCTFTTKTRLSPSHPFYPLAFFLPVYVIWTFTNVGIQMMNYLKAELSLVLRHLQQPFARAKKHRFAAGNRLIWP
jgi:hypothetical protein